MAILGNLVTVFSADLTNLKDGVSQYGKELDTAEKENKKFEQSLGSLQASFTTVMAGFGIGAGVVTASAYAAAKYGDAIMDVHYATGASIEDVQRWKAAATQTGTSFEGLSTTMRMMTQRIGEFRDPGSEMSKTLNKIGVSAIDAQGNVKNTTTLMWDIINALNKLPEGEQRSSASMVIFGRSWAQLAPMISEAREAQEAFNKKDPFSDEKIRRMHEAEVSLDKIGSKLNTITVRFGQQFGGAFEYLANELDRLDKWIAGFDSKTGELGKGIENSIGDAIAYIKNPAGGNRQYSTMRATIERSEANKVTGPEVPGSNEDISTTNQYSSALSSLADAMRAYKNAVAEAADEQQRLQDIEKDYQRELSIVNQRDISAVRNLYTRHQWAVEDQQSRIAESQVGVAAGAAAVATTGANAAGFSLNIGTVNLSKDYPVDQMIRDYEEYFRNSAYQQGA